MIRQLLFRICILHKLNEHRIFWLSKLPEFDLLFLVIFVLLKYNNKKVAEKPKTLNNLLL